MHKDNSVETDICYKPTNTHDWLPYDSAHPDHTKNNIPYNLVKRIIAFVSNPEKVIIRLDKLKQFLKDCKYSEHVISKSILNTKFQGPASNPERSKNVIPFVTIYCPNIDNKSWTQIVKNKFKNIRNEHLKSIYEDTNFILSLKQPKNLYRELASSIFLSSFKNIRKPGTYKCSDKRWKICQNYLNETNKFKTSNGRVWEICREIGCHSVNVIYYLKYKVCNEKKNINWENNGDNTKGFKFRIN